MAMQETKLNVSLKPGFRQFFPDINDTDKIDASVQLSLAIGLFVEKRITLARAAELAGKSIGEFVKILTRYNIPWLEYTEEQERQDELTLDYLAGLEGND
jgi:predicted HTH domain antitoxin